MMLARHRSQGRLKSEGCLSIALELTRFDHLIYVSNSMSLVPPAFHRSALASRPPKSLPTSCFARVYHHAPEIEPPEGRNIFRGTLAVAVMRETLGATLTYPAL
jgi:hypothetical protein